MLALLAWACPRPDNKPVAKNILSGVESRRVQGIPVVQRYLPGKPVSVRIIIQHEDIAALPGQAWMALKAAQSGGTKELSPSELTLELEKVAARLSFTGGKQQHSLNLDCLPEYFSQAWDLLAKQIIEANLTIEAFESAKDQSLASLKSWAQSPATWTLWQVAKDLRQDGDRSLPEGDSLALGTLGYPEVKATYFRDLMLRCRMSVVAVGGISPEVLDEQITRSLALLPPGNCPEMAAAGAVESDKGPFLQTKPTPVTHIRIGFEGAEACSETAAWQRIGLQILTEKLNYRLIKNREPVLARDISFEFLGTHPSILMVSATPASAILELLMTLKEIQQSGFSEEEIKEMAERLELRALLPLQSSAGQAELIRTALNSRGSVDCSEYFSGLQVATAAQVRQSLAEQGKRLRWAVWGQTTNLPSLPAELFQPD